MVNTLQLDYYAPVQKCRVYLEALPYIGHKSGQRMHLEPIQQTLFEDKILYATQCILHQKNTRNTYELRSRLNFQKIAVEISSALVPRNLPSTMRFLVKMSSTIPLRVNMMAGNCTEAYHTRVYVHVFRHTTWHSNDILFTFL